MLRTTIIALSVVNLLLHIAGALLLKNSAWGVHLYAFFAPWVLVASTGVAAGAAWWTLRLGTWRQQGAQRSAPLPDPFGWPASKRLLAFAGITVAAGALFWLARIRHTLLGDGNTILIDLPTSTPFHAREPLTAFVNQHLYRIVARYTENSVATEDVVQRTVALGSVVFGMLLVPVALGLARELCALGSAPTTHSAQKQRTASGQPIASPPAHETSSAAIWLVASLILTQGYVQLLFGYIEHYTYYLVAVGLFLLCAFRFLAGRSSFIPVVAAFVLAFCLHMSAGVLAPALLMLGIYGLANRDARRGVLFAFAGGGVLLILLGVVAKSMSGFDLGQQVVRFMAEVRRNALDLSYMFSVKHISDFTNEQLLIGPLGLFLFLPAVVAATLQHRLRTPAVAFLVTVGGCYLAASWVIRDSNLGYARDWDLLAPGGLVFTLAGLGLWFAVGPPARSASPFLGLALVTSLYHTVPWIALNTSEDRALERMAVLPLGAGRSETAIATAHLRRGDRQLGIEWLQKAIQVHPNNNAFALLGLTYAEAGDMNAAAEAFARAVQIRPDKLSYRHNLVQMLTRAGRFEDTLPHYEELCRLEPKKPGHWMGRARALAAIGRKSEATAIMERMIAPAEARLRTHPNDKTANLELGTMLVATGNPAQALPYLQRGLQLDPKSPTGLYNMALALLGLNRGPEAQPFLQEFMRQNPDRLARAQAERLLQRIRTP